MDFQDLYRNQSSLFLFILLNWAITLGWFITLTGQMIEARLPVPQGLLTLGVILALALGSTLMAQHALYYSGALLLLTIGGPFTLQTLNKREHAMIDAEQTQRHVLALAGNPRNVSARLKLAETCQRVGLLAPAVYHLKEAISMSPQHFQSEKIMLKSWQRDLDTGLYERRLICPKCRFSNEPKELYCQRCGASILYLTVAGFWMPQGMPLKLLKVWGIASFVSLLAPLIALKAPAPLTLPLEGLTLGLGLFALYRSLR